MLSDPSPRCKKETMKKVRTDFGYTLKDLTYQEVDCKSTDDCENAEIEDCKLICLNDERCISMQHCPIDKKCKMYAVAPSKFGQVESDCNIYVKSCGKLYEL